MWSVGCIFAEFLGRKVFLPGQKGFDQLHLILQKLGTPDDDVIDRIPSEKVPTNPSKMATQEWCIYSTHPVFPLRLS